MSLMQVYAIQKVRWNNHIKLRDGYIYDETDIKFKNMNEIIQLSGVCMFAAILCGLTGLAGGMVISALFFHYNMLPQVIVNTNSYITLIASVTTCLQFLILEELNMYYALVIGIECIICTIIGIQAVNIYIAKSGKQSVIAIALSIVLVICLACLPFHFYLKFVHSEG